MVGNFYLFLRIAFWGILFSFFKINQDTTVSSAVRTRKGTPFLFYSGQLFIANDQIYFQVIWFHSLETRILWKHKSMSVSVKWGLWYRMLKQNFIFSQSKQQFWNKEHFLYCLGQEDTETDVTNILIDVCAPGDSM